MKKIENQYLKVEQSEDGYIHLHHKNDGVIVLAQTCTTSGGRDLGNGIFDKARYFGNDCC